MIFMISLKNTKIEFICTGEHQKLRFRQISSKNLPVWVSLEEITS